MSSTSLYPLIQDEVPTASSLLKLAFPEQLHKMLDEMERTGQSHVASWLPHGRCFKVHNKDDFTEALLGRWFHQTKYASFQRQLNMYNFQRVPSGTDKGSYFHEKFVRDKPQQARQVHRVETKGQGPRRPGLATIVPNFYAMPFLSAPPVDGRAASGTTSPPSESTTAQVEAPTVQVEAPAAGVSVIPSLFGSVPPTTATPWGGPSAMNDVAAYPPVTHGTFSGSSSVRSIPPGPLMTNLHATVPAVPMGQVERANLWMLLQLWQQECEQTRRLDEVLAWLDQYNQSRQHVPVTLSFNQVLALLQAHFG